jgi:hypothetical protein
MVRERAQGPEPEPEPEPEREREREPGPGPGPESRLPCRSRCHHHHRPHSHSMPRMRYPEKGGVIRGGAGGESSSLGLANTGTGQGDEPERRSAHASLDGEGGVGTEAWVPRCQQLRFSLRLHQRPALNLSQEVYHRPGYRRLIALTTRPTRRSAGAGGAVLSTALGGAACCYKCAALPLDGYLL